MSYYRETMNRAFGMRRYGLFMEELGRVTDADFEVIEPTKEQHGNDESAGDGTNTGSPGTTTAYQTGWHPECYGFE